MDRFERGWAWTRALLGLAVDELHLCGAPTLVPLARALATRCGDLPLEVRWKEKEKEEDN